MPAQKQQEKKTKKFSARSHSRSASYGRNLNKLGRITSTEEIHQRPGLNRSKSTDGTLVRKNRSFTKLSTLQPLARTRSHQQVQQRKGGKVVLEFNNDQESSDDENHEGSKKEESEEEVEEFSDDEQSSQSNQPDNTQLKLSYKAPAQFSHTHIPQGSPLSSNTSSQQTKESTEPEVGASKALRNSLAAMTSNLTLNDTAGKQPVDDLNQKQQDQSVDQYKESLSEYYQNMILSQSTGAVRAFGDQPFSNSLVQGRTEGPTTNGHEKSKDSLQYIHSNDHISGTLGNMKSLASSTNSLRQFTMQNIGGESVPNDTASVISGFKGKQPSGVGFVSNSKLQREPSVGTPQNFNQFLKSNNSNIETRTQQKLWLQRENSLLDLPSASNNSNNPSLRRDLERVSREYTNVRRFFNPSVESVKRIHSKSIDKSQLNGRNNSSIIKNIDTNDFQAKIFKLWIEGESSSSSDNRRSQNPTIGSQYNQQQQNNSHQKMYSQQRPSIIQTANMSMTGLGNSLRSPVAPTTRAVDRANNSPENKRIDLAAVRTPEEHVQKLS
ncbi:Midasin [Wickerhamomyces ciferrii]|uniref:Midasin n=1 Tax=Wickerhamomyces ciferrii (strain ATCC 14091 / BCRC 22168 / CBS 111 / JCM 3599 / NBRC 0793 / NRRL Y-1031 F-60-10) TaxID=1206466 RepID=K0KYY7_WICCF|nr:Midasin [Wickerhamomyces ciferrii]CCH46609.1 Midasin [Wickerhamomyces ciferrii]